MRFVIYFVTRYLGKAEVEYYYNNHTFWGIFLPFMKERKLKNKYMFLFVVFTIKPQKHLKLITGSSYIFHFLLLLDKRNRRLGGIGCFQPYTNQADIASNVFQVHRRTYVSGML